MPAGRAWGGAPGDGDWGIPGAPGIPGGTGRGGMGGRPAWACDAGGVGTGAP